MWDKGTGAPSLAYTDQAVTLEGAGCAPFLQNEALTVGWYCVTSSCLHTNGGHIGRCTCHAHMHNPLRVHLCGQAHAHRPVSMTPSTPPCVHECKRVDPRPRSRAPRPACESTCALTCIHDIMQPALRARTTPIHDHMRPALRARAYAPALHARTYAHQHSNAHMIPHSLTPHMHLPAWTFAWTIPCTHKTWGEAAWSCMTVSSYHLGYHVHCYRLRPKKNTLYFLFHVSGCKGV